VSAHHLTVTAAKTGQHSVLRLAGTIDLATVDELVTQAVKILHETSDVLTFDFTSVNFCDSTGLTALMRVNRAAVTLGVQIRIDSPQPHIQRALTITGLASLFGVPDYVDDQT
jgi:anti-sigma B factor antagonist